MNSEYRIELNGKFMAEEATLELALETLDDEEKALTGEWSVSLTDDTRRCGKRCLAEASTLDAAVAAADADEYSDLPLPEETMTRAQMWGY